MALETFDAVTLRSQDYGETSLIMSLFTREQGLVKGIAKGARGRRSRFGTALEPLQRIRVTLSIRTSRDLQTLTQADLVNPFSSLRHELFRATYAQAVAELLARMAWHSDPGPRLFELLLTVLASLEEGIGDPELLFYAFQIHLAEELGYALHMEDCAGCRGTLEQGGRFSLHRGAAFCSRCYPGEGSTVSFTGETAHLIQALGRTSGVAASAALDPDSGTRRTSARLLRRHLEYHTETDLELRSLLVAESLQRYGTMDVKRVQE